MLRGCAGASWWRVLSAFVRCAVRRSQWRSFILCDTSVSRLRKGHICEVVSTRQAGRLQNLNISSRRAGCCVHLMRVIVVEEAVCFVTPQVV